jgi:hypothetical protein
MGTKLFTYKVIHSDEDECKSIIEVKVAFVNLNLFKQKL